MSPAPPPALRSRTVPTKLHTAPTPGSPARSAATSRPRSKSSVWIVTRAMAKIVPLLDCAPMATPFFAFPKAKATLPA